MKSTIETSEQLRDLLLKIRESGVRPSSVADRAGVNRGGLSKFMSGKSKHLRSDVFMRIVMVARDDAQRLRL